MKMSAKTARAKRHQARRSAVSKLSLVSLMDIFTILVFFLIVNSSSVEVLEADKSIKLPQSVSKTLAKDNLLLLISGDDIIVQGNKIASLSQVAASESETIEPLKSELTHHRERTQQHDDEPSAITIMGDKSLEYSLLKKILLTCSAAGFGDISLAVEQTATLSEQGAGNVQ